MKAQKLFLSALALCALASCSAPVANSSSESSASTSESNSVALIKTLESKLYIASTTAFTFPCSLFSNAGEYVPYIKLGDFLSSYNAIVTGGIQVFAKDGNVVKNAFSLGTMTFDVEKNQIVSTDLDKFLSMYEDAHLNHDSLQAEATATAKIDNEKCSSTVGKTITWNLDDYYMQLVSYENEVYVPYSILQTIFFSPRSLSFAFNGSDFYNVSSFLAFFDNPKERTLSEFGKAYYGGPLGGIKERSEEYSKYFYGSFLFTMEASNGHIGTMDFASLDKKLDSLGYKSKLLSSDSYTADAAVCDAVCKLFGDGGHTGFIFTGVTAGMDIDRDIPLMNKVFETDSRLVAKTNVQNYLTALRSKAEVAPGLRVEGETAILTFDSFAVGAIDQTTGKVNNLTPESVVNDNKSTFALFYNSFEEIKKNENVKNVVFDVSLNGGGAAIALGESLSFLTDDDVTFSTKNPLTGSKNVECVAYDNDLDGDFSDKDSYAGKYNFYILTSPVSFSCGNAFPCIASDYGYAKIIGQKSGGGDCVVGYATAVDGTYWQMSSNTSIIRSSGHTVDDGCPVDYEIDYARFYDANYLNTYLSALNA